MEYPRGLIIILLLVSLGFCGDASSIYAGEAGWWLSLIVLVGRIVAIVGIILRTTLGWGLAVGFFVVILGLNGLAVSMVGEINGVTTIVRLVLPFCCLLYLILAKGHFDQ